MRRVVGYVLVGLGVALLVLGIAVRTAIYPALAVAPATYPAPDTPKTDPPAGIQKSHGDQMTVLVARDVSGKPVTQVQTLNVDSTRTTASVPGASVGRDLFWRTQVDTGSPDLGGAPFNQSWEGVCFDRGNAEQADGCAQKPYRAENGVVTPVTRDGVFLKFPFGTARTTYRYWDGIAGKSFDAVYVGTDTIQDLPVYKFVQNITQVPVPQRLPDGTVQQTTDVPGKLFGLGESAPAVKAVDTYSNVRTLWVEPETGTIIKGTEDIKRVFVFNGQEVPELVGKIGYTDATVTANVTQTKDNAGKLYLVRVVAPVVLIALGVLLAVAGLVLVFLLDRSGRRRRPDGAGGEEEPTGTVIDLTSKDRQPADGVS